MGKRQNRILIFILAISIFLGYAAWETFIYGSYTSTSGIGITKIEVNNNNLEIIGSTFDGGSGAFAGYDYTIKGDRMYVKLRCCLGTGIHPLGEFSIRINDEKIWQVKSIYLQGVRHDKRLIWHKQ